MVLQVQVLRSELAEVVGEISTRPHWPGAGLLPGGLLHHPRHLLVREALQSPLS